jgi:hypothetical protein
MMKNFKNFVKESKNPIKIVQSLTDLIQKRVKNISHNSHFFSNLMAKYFKFEKFMVVSKIEFSSNLDDFRHIYVYNNGKYLDGDGYHSKADIIDKFNMSNETFKDLTFYVDIDDMKKILNKNEVTLTTKQQKELDDLVRQFSQLL